MQKVQNHGDDRNKGSCVHCGGANETRDHAPSLVFLDDPLPPDLPASPSCANCNQSFSNDEAYLACLLECVAAGKTEPDNMAREKIAALMRHRPSLVAELEAARRVEAGQTVFFCDQERVRKVVLKLARCHAAFEQNEPRTDEPEAIWFRPLSLMSEQEREEFEGSECGLALWPEVGSRAMMRTLVVGNEAFGAGWLEVQPGRYRYRVSQEDGQRIQFVIREYLACEVVWG